MKIQSMFQKDIDRPINGVVKVMQDDQQSLKDELSEYIITKELRRHFATFFDNYVKAIDTPTDKIGVWISGFFGSGKSHFLKMLSYLLANKEVDGKHAFDYFADKFDDPMMYATVQKCVRIPTESILFNIDIEGPINKDKTAVLRVFAKVFYNHCGFYGEDLKVAKLERFIDKQGKTDAFRAAFKEVNGDEWINARDSAAFFEDDVVEVLQSVLGMSETAARNWFNGEENADMSIKQLVSEIKEYVDSKEGNFRLLFCVDEVGQYIGDDGDLMMNLQSLVEEIGDKCRGKVWVMVTSQEAIDSVVKITGNDFSKIQGRFNTRLSLSSSSVDEVIKKRVLAKTEDADHLLQMEYEKEASGLKSLFAFDNPILDIKGFTSAAEFSATFPFVPYQFIVIQKVLAEIRKHGNSGKHLSGGERSMLSGFQEAAQKIENKDENALVPFYQFYDTVHTFLESAIRRVIDRCQNAADANDGLEQQDVNVLKLLYLVRYIEDVKANIENIAILMIDDIHTDKIALRASITASLERLLSQNYISRNGDTYGFRHPRRGLAGCCPDHWLAVSVLQHRAERRYLRPAQEERQDHEGAHSCRHAAFHPGLDRPLYGGKLPRQTLAGRSPQCRAARRLEILSGRSRAGTGGRNPAYKAPREIQDHQAGRDQGHRPLHGQRSYPCLCVRCADADLYRRRLGSARGGAEHPQE